MVAVKAISRRRVNARKSITAQADSTTSHAASRAIAAESTADPANGEMGILFCRRK